MTEIEYFYSAHSAFAYIGSRLLIEISERTDSVIVHKPVDLRAVVAAVSGEPYGYRSDAHRAYFYNREVERWSEFRNAPLVDFRPTWHDEPLDLANGFIVSAIQQGIPVDELAHAILQAHWMDDANFNDPETLRSISISIDIDPEPMLATAMSKQVQSVHQMNTQEAINRGVFGSPTYFVNGDMFYGQDHLELVERALEKPFAGTWPKQGGG